MMKKTLVVSEDGMFASQPLSFADILQLTCSCVASAAKTMMSQAENDKEAQEIEKELFDLANVSFSQCLDFAFPNQELRPDLTEEAIMEAENAILKRAAEDMENVGEPEKIIPFPTGSNPEPAGTYDPRECTRVSDPEDVMPEKGE